MKSQNVAQSAMGAADALPTSGDQGENSAVGVDMSYAPVEAHEHIKDVVDEARVPAETREGVPVELVDTSRSTMAPVGDSPGDLGETPSTDAAANDPPPPHRFKLLQGLPSFWHDRLIEAGLILSMGLYYLVGNANLGADNFLHIPPYIYSLPFLALFVALSWYRLPFAVALLPLALPYYMVQKTVFSYGSGSHKLAFSLAEISLWAIVLVAVGQILLQGKNWRYRLSWADLRDRLGPFPLPILVFVVAALFSIVVAVERSTALRAFREEVFDPLIYLLLALACLRTRPDLKRLLGAFWGSAMIIAIIGLIQYFFFANQLQTQSLGAGRVDAVYGSANSIGLFFDYVLPLGMALLIFQVGRALRFPGNWRICLLILASFVPLVGVVVLSQSLGTALALPVALLFILAMSVRSRKTLLIGAGVLLVLALGGGLVLHRPLANFLANWHDNTRHISTLTKRYYLWQSALDMIRHYPWFGVGMDNWLCHYTTNSACLASATQQHFLIYSSPGYGWTGLSDEPTLSHPHEVFLHVWVSVGIFGLLAFLAVLALFFWLFARIVKTVRASVRVGTASLEWMVIGVGGAMLAALCQGLVDSAFLEQDLAFCFWMLVAALLILRVLTKTPWRGKTAH